MSDLARQLDIHPNYISQVINSVEQKNFYDFINEHRVEEFKQLVSLSENQHFTLLALAFECGFNSKTSFNRNFKKAMGNDAFHLSGTAQYPFGSVSVFCFLCPVLRNAA